MDNTSIIEFLCPEGHKIRCPKEQAGRQAKCPRCGVRFRIPTLAELGLEAENSEIDLPMQDPSQVNRAPHQPAVHEPAESEWQQDSKVGQSNGSGKLSSPPDAGSAEPPAAKEEQFEFLCPNGHHLHGPASLQGRPGECPECGSRFRIPMLDQSDDPSASGETLAAGEFEAIESSVGGPPLDLLEVLEEARLSSISRLGGAANMAAADAAMPASLAGAHPLGKLFAELWACKGETSRVEVHLESGSVLLPDGYIKSLSQQSHAVLVGTESDGSSTLTVVSWESVSRIILRGVQNVPGEVSR